VPGPKKARAHASRTSAAGSVAAAADEVHFDFGSVDAAVDALGRLSRRRSELIRRSFVAADQFRAFMRTVGLEVEKARWAEVTSWHRLLAGWILGEPGGRRVELLALQFQDGLGTHGFKERTSDFTRTTPMAATVLSIAALHFAGMLIPTAIELALTAVALGIEKPIVVEGEAKRSEVQRYRLHDDRLRAWRRRIARVWQSIAITVNAGLRELGLPEAKLPRRFALSRREIAKRAKQAKIRRKTLR
jgi:hypothetical protein